jgi:cation-transporting ATPase I
VLAVAERAAARPDELTDARITELTFRGLLAMADPVRPTAATAVAAVCRAGVDVVMVTGDHPSTAEAIAAELGILNGRRVVTGPELDAMDDVRLAAVLPEVSVFARTTPEHKARIVGTLQAGGHVVAVTGDGANDAPAIRRADVGVAFGQRATSAAREAADVVVADDRIETIIDAIIEGRALWASVRDAVSMLLGGNLGEIAFTLGVGLFTRTGSPLNARQLLLVNLLTDILPAMALALRPPPHATPERLLREGPDASLGRALTRDVAIRAAATAGSAGAGWLVGRATGTRRHAGTVALVALVGSQLGQTAVAGWRSPLVLGATVVSAGALAAIVQTPGVSQFFGCTPLGPFGWGTGVSAAAAGTGAAVLLPAASRALVPARTTALPRRSHDHHRTS